MTVFSRLSTAGGPVLVNVSLTSDYGYVVLTGIASGFLLAWQAMQVGKMRKKFGINYPIMYSTDNDLFNCYQRAHQNTLENYPQFLMLLFIGGLQYPTLTAASGALWIASRVAFSLGYYTGDPRNRMRGSFGYLGLFGMLATTGSFAAKLLGWV